jgi:flagellar basal-body rod protein FlgF
MDNTMYVGISKQMILRRELDIVANNIANVDTTGFKVESVMTAADPEKPARTFGGPSPVQFAVDNGLARDFSQGKMETTGSPLDLAIDGQAFFTVSTADGDRYTRDGRFMSDPQGRLTTQSGDPVLDASGSPITLNPQGSPPLVGRDGTITQKIAGQVDEQVIGKIAVVRFDSLSALSKDGKGLYSNNSSSSPTPAPDAAVQQGMLETSNVQPVLQITDLIRIQRAYESINQMISNTSDLSKTAIERLGSSSQQ